MSLTQPTGAPARLNYRILLAAGIIAVLPSIPVAEAQQARGDGTVSARATAPAASVEAYWTAERLKSAVPLDLPRAAGAPGKASDSAAQTGSGQFHEGRSPTLDVGDDLQRQLFVPDQADSLSDPKPTDFGTAGYYFTTSRLFPPKAERRYPNSAAGKLFFSDTVHGGNFVCSASVIAYRLIVTAGHCVAHGSSTAPHFYANILFIPAYASGNAPYKQWAWTNAVTTANWYFNGGVPNVQDVAIVGLADTVYKKQLRRIGSVTGWLGWWTLWGRQYPNHITQLGYPCNLDSCALMQINNAQGVRIVSNNVELGSLMQGGSSGGPWIQDYGVPPTGSSSYTAGNWVLGTTSYQYTGASVLGSSIFQNAGYSGGGFGDLWNTGCAWQTGNC